MKSKLKLIIQIILSHYNCRKWMYSRFPDERKQSFFRILFESLRRCNAALMRYNHPSSDILHSNWLRIRNAVHIEFCRKNDMIHIELNIPCIRLMPRSLLVHWHRHVLRLHIDQTRYRQMNARVLHHREPNCDILRSEYLQFWSCSP